MNSLRTPLTATQIRPHILTKSHIVQLTCKRRWLQPQKSRILAVAPLGWAGGNGSEHNSTWDIDMAIMNGLSFVVNTK